MKVLHVSSGLDPRTGGTATAAILVALAARKAGIEPTLVYPAAPGSEAEIAPLLAALDRAGIAHHGFPFAARGGARSVGWGISPALNRWLKSQAGGFDLVHAHSVWVWSSVAAVRAARRAGRPVLVMPHEGLTRFDMAQASSRWLRQAKRLLRFWYLRHTDRFIVASELERLDSNLGEDQAVALAHPVFDESAPAPPPRRLPEAGPFTVGFLGRLHPKKNLHRLIDAVARVPATRLVIGGDGPAELKSGLEHRVAQHGLQDRVTWRGFVAAPDKDAFLRSVDLIAMPSQFECFGLVGAEALAQGTPVLLSPTVGIAEMVQQAGCGLVIPPRADAIAAALARIAQEGLLPRLAAAARPAALAHFSFAAHGSALARIYGEMIEGRGALTRRGAAHN